MLPPRPDEDGVTPSADATCNGLLFPELLDLVHHLLRQHETRLCLNMLEALKHTESAHVTNTLQEFVQSELSSPSEGLQALAQRVQGFGGCQGKCESFKKAGKVSILDGGARQTLHEVMGSMDTGAGCQPRHDRATDVMGSDSSNTFPSRASNSIIQVGDTPTCAATPAQGSFCLAPYLDVNGSSGHGASSKQSQAESSHVHPGSQDESPGTEDRDDKEDHDEYEDSDDEDELEHLQEVDENARKVAGAKSPLSLRSLRKKIGIVHPSSSARLVWDCFGLAFVCGEGVCVPLSLGFDVRISDWWQWSATVFFAIDMIAQFFTGYYRDGNLIMQHSVIIRHYLVSFFIIDLIATVPWELVLKGIGGNSAASLSLARVARVGKTLRLLRLIRVFRIVRMKELLTHLETLLSAYKIGLVLHLLKVPTLFLILCHWAACLWGFLGQPEEKALEPHSIDSCEPGGPCEFGIEGSPWLRRYGMDNYKAATQYLIALQSSAGLLTGVGGGLEPGFWSERIYVLGMMIGSFFLCAVILSRIVVVVDEMSKSQSELKKQLRDAKAFMLARRIPRLLQSKVMQHIEFQAKSRSENEASLKGFMQLLSPWLRLEITEHMNRGVISHHPFFAELPNKLVKHICSAAQIVICAPGDIVVQQGHRATNMCFLVQGRLKVRPPQQPKKTNGGPRIAPRLLDPPCWVGDLCLFEDEVVRTNTVLSVGHAELLVLTKEALLALLEEFPGARPHYEAYRARLRDEEDDRKKAKCQYCGRPGHHGPDCPDLEKMCAHNKSEGRASRSHRQLLSARSFLNPLKFLNMGKGTSEPVRISTSSAKQEPGNCGFETLDSVVCNQPEANGRCVHSKLKGVSERSGQLPASARNTCESQASGNRYATGDLTSASSRSEAAITAWSTAPQHPDSRAMLVPGQPPPSKLSGEDDHDNFLR